MRHIQKTFVSEKSVIVITVNGKDDIDIQTYLVSNNELKLFDMVKNKSLEFALQLVSDICRIKCRNYKLEDEMKYFIKSAVIVAGSGDHG